MARETLPARVEALFKERKIWEALWDTVYRYVAPERATIFRDNLSPQEIQTEVFDSTAIDAAERLTNLLISGLIPPWQNWFRLQAGLGITEREDREKLRPIFEDAQLKMADLLRKGRFYEEMQPVLIDRIVGGTGCLEVTPVNGHLEFKAVSLSEIAIAEDAYGRVSMVARRTTWPTKSLLDEYGDKLSSTWKAQYKDKPLARHPVIYVTERQADGQWQWAQMLNEADPGKGGPSIELERSVDPLPRLLVTRWSKMPGSPYGRGPALRVLADVRMLNKVKELSIKNAALAVSGVYTVVNDGVINPYTLTIEPGARIPVMSNNPNDRSIEALPTSTDFNVGMLVMDDLRNSIKQAFMADQFQPLGRTPASATEIAERTRVIASDMGATLARLQDEVLTPVLQWTLWWLRQSGEVSAELKADGQAGQVQYVSRLSQAQWAEEKSNLLNLASIAAQFGQFDPRAGLTINTEAAIRRVAELDNIPTSLLRSTEEVQELIDEANAKQPEGPPQEGGNPQAPQPQ